MFHWKGRIASPQIPADDTYLRVGKGEEEISLEINGHCPDCLSPSTLSAIPFFKNIVLAHITESGSDDDDENDDHDDYDGDDSDDDNEN